jgi:hypothetical protein
MEEMTSGAVNRETSSDDCKLRAKIAEILKPVSIMKK